MAGERWCGCEEMMAKDEEKCEGEDIREDEGKKGKSVISTYTASDV